MRHAGVDSVVGWLLLLAGASGARADDLAGRYAIRGQDATGSYRGQGEVRDLGGGQYRLVAHYDGRPADWEARATRQGDVLSAVVPAEPGLVHALGATAAGAGRLLGAYVRRSDGALAGRWRQEGATAPLRDERWIPEGDTGEQTFALAADRWRVGTATSLPAGGTARLLVPLPGGRLVIEAPAGARLRVRGPDGVLLPGDAAIGVSIPRAGAHQVTLEGTGGRLVARYTIAASLPAAEAPYNFWYFPLFDDGVDNGNNLYEEGGVYDKLDRLFQLDPLEEPFDGARHLDAQSGRPFAPPADALWRYDPSTTRGFAFCYQRTESRALGWMGHCGGATVASSLYRAPRGCSLTAPDGSTVEFTAEEVEGILSAFFEGVPVETETYFQGCPAGPPGPGTGTSPNLDFTNRYADDFWRGLVEGIAGAGRPLVCDLRASGPNPAQNWNHVLLGFRATLSAVADSEELVDFDLTVWATSDVFPSGEEQGRRTERYRFRLVCRDGRVVPDGPGQDWLAASHFAPRYLYRVIGIHGDPDPACKNVPLGRRIGLARLEQAFGLVRRD